jgi:uncharacterized membrane protein (DUF2068 family)
MASPSAAAPHPTSEPERRDRLLPWIAAERTLRSVLLLAVGIALVTHPHENWAHEVSRLAQHLGMDPKDNWIQRLVHKVKRIRAHEDMVFGVAALAYGALEATEAYGLFRRRPWGEWLTVVATSVLFVPELWELAKSVSLLKFAALAVNALVVAYLVWRLRRRRLSHPS